MVQAGTYPDLSGRIASRLRAGEITPAEALRLASGTERRKAGQAKPDDQEKRQRIETILAELEALPGLRRVKQVVREIQAFAVIGRLRAQEGLAPDKQALHMIFTGNPGTGKTTVARLLGRLFREMEVLSKGHLVEVERADLVGEYIGHTAQKTREVIGRAQGGILFLDEAYSLARGGEKDFGKESIDCIVKALEDRRGDLLFILAGYPAEMAWFLAQNPGLRSRFPMRIIFADYTPQELVEITRQMLTAKQYSASADALAYLKAKLSASPEGNARTVRNLVETAVRTQAVRLLKRSQQATLSRQELMEITRDDLIRAMHHHETPIP